MDGEFESFKEQVRSTANIVEVISGYVPLKKRGQNFSVINIIVFFFADCKGQRQFLEEIS